MNPIDVLPDAKIERCGPVSQIFLDRGVESFRAACCAVKAMPYGSNSNSENSLILFEEGCGTCTTKHGAISRLAQELELPIYKNLGFYRLNDTIVTGVNEIIRPHGLRFIPQIHCFLEYETYRVDLTEGNCNGKNQTIDDYDFVVRVQPDITAQQEEAYYLAYLRHYFEIEPSLQTVGETDVLKLLAACDHQVKYQCSLMSSQLINA
ncbi:MAG: hypothetical protein AAF171_16210 [Cyanobacteria bacterium P01_A01_bin.116]